MLKETYSFKSISAVIDKHLSVKNIAIDIHKTIIYYQDIIVDIKKVEQLDSKELETIIRFKQFLETIFSISQQATEILNKKGI